MRFFKKFSISVIAFISIFLSPSSAFAESYIMKVAFVGNPELTNSVVRKIFDKVEIFNEGNTSLDAFGLRIATTDDMVWYKFKSPLIADHLEKAVSPACNIVFMVVDFLSEKDDSNDIITKNVFAIRRLSGGSKVVVIALNAERLPEHIIEDFTVARDYYGKNNFDYILSLSAQDDETFRNSFFEATDKVVDWKKLPVLSENDRAVFHKLDPAGAIVSKFFGDMVGMRDFKNELKKVIVRIVQNKRDEERGKAKHTNPSYHMVLMGNPGTGKTTVARKMADVLYDAGVISKNTFLQVERKNLVGQYIGDTEKIVEEILKKAEGGVLFIDEAYSLVGAGDRDYGKHVIEGILTSMTDNRCIIIVAGYPNKMQEFLNSNPGLSRRFTYHINIPDYNGKDLFAIFKNLIIKNGFKVQPAEEHNIQDLVEEYFLEQKVKLKENFGNAGSVESFFEAVMNERAMRLSCHPDVLEDFITLEDVLNAIEK